MQEATMSEEAEAAKIAKRRVGRSPSYPFINVQKALHQTRALYDSEGDYAAPLASATQAWGYSPTSSGGRQTLATLKYYGLIDITGEGDGRKVKVSDVAKRILLDEREDATERNNLIRRVALTPAAHKVLFEEYPKGLASDASVHHFLMFEQGFNKEAAADVLGEFKETASFARIYEPDQGVDKSTTLEDIVADKTPSEIKVGDKIQATVDGVDQFPNGATVLGFTDDGAWIFTDESKSAVKLEEATVMEPAPKLPVMERPEVPTHLIYPKKDERPQEGMRNATFPLEEGDVTLTFPDGLSDQSRKLLGMYLNIFLGKEDEKRN
jgi:hypothetical protein